MARCAICWSNNLPYGCVADHVASIEEYVSRVYGDDCSKTLFIWSRGIFAAHMAREISRGRVEARNSHSLGL